MLIDDLKKYKVILASQSPRRHHLLKELGVDFEIRVKSVKEEYPKRLQREEIATYLAHLKAQPHKDELQENELLITSDTIVWIDGKVLEKPSGREEAIEMLYQLSGNMHEVITGVCLTTGNKQKVFFEETKVFFQKLSNEEVTYYVDKFKPFDKAGSYGIQEWIGYIGIERIEGDFFNVMGLPLQRLYRELALLLKA